MHDYAVCHRVLTSCTDRNDVIDGPVSRVQVVFGHVNVLTAAWISTHRTISLDQVIDSELVSMSHCISTPTDSRLLRIIGGTWFVPVRNRTDVASPILWRQCGRPLTINAKRQMAQDWVVMNVSVSFLGLRAARRAVSFV
jgi:hypothetical protein